MAIRILIVECTLNWSEDILARKHGGRLFSVYFYQDKLGVHCCEMTPSYECYYMEDFVVFPSDVQEKLMEDDYLWDEIDNEIRSNMYCENVVYHHCSVVDSKPEMDTFLEWAKLVHMWTMRYDKKNNDDGLDLRDQEVEDGIREELQGNPMW